ncbi:uncharacterized protein BDW43DRAFT_217359 [Aspergillus alliaceus]|uniref:uncharacterized protein n=1 Tax=Petromyces alliaceus TaxID=209559 RepID=UPI0012A661DC|nr:uncharacterized protein BDW43DRAFT_217359 [Aspergillus alliaceus]KAB8228427.1 hypothetical protein BDW43DRAFT_217359 [Aspergillus alliaceus]
MVMVMAVAFSQNRIEIHCTVIEINTQDGIGQENWLELRGDQNKELKWSIGVFFFIFYFFNFFLLFFSLLFFIFISVLSFFTYLLTYLFIYYLPLSKKRKEPPCRAIMYCTCNLVL